MATRITKRGKFRLNKKTTNDRIRAVYERMDMTYEDFAEWLGVSPYSVESWFKPKTSRSHRMAAATTAKLAETLEKQTILVESS